MIKDSFLRTEMMLGKDGMKKLSDSFVVLAGVGAVGGWAFEALVRAGVGKIRVIDYDKVEITNINRQLFATVETVGNVKAELAKARAKSINPDIEVEAATVFINGDNADNMLLGNPDLLIDAIDTISCKVQLLKAASIRELPAFSSMGAALRTDTEMIRCAKLSKTKICPLAKMVRQGLKRENVNIDLITTVYSEEKPKTSPNKKDENGKSVLGSLPTIPPIFGFTLANLAILHLVHYKGE